MDENEPIVPLQRVMDSVDDYGDPNWEPEPVDAGPGGWFICLFSPPPAFLFRTELGLWSFVSLDSTLVVSSRCHSTLDMFFCST